MDVPFISSGAMNRAHYSIVRQVESASSVQQANQYLSLHIKRLHERLSRPSLNLKECKECLIMLLYCAMAITQDILPTGVFDFALPHALNLAEAGKTVNDKRIGYLFCTELMPLNHDFRLMMVNTLRKDLESSNIPRVCLALDNLISFANDDVVPAVQPILCDLLLHNYPNIRRRAILAFRALSVFEPQLLCQISAPILKRLRDPVDSVRNSALVVAAGIPMSDPNFSRIREMVNAQMAPSEALLNPSIFVTTLQCLQVLGMSEENTSVALRLVQISSQSRHSAALLGLFRLLSQQTTSKLISAEKSHGTSIVKYLQDYLTSQYPNDQYIYLQCLHVLDPVLWAGLCEDQPAVLEGWEVERVMRFSDSPDSLIRRTTLSILNRIEPSIVSTYFSKALQTIPFSRNVSSLSACATSLLDVIEIQSVEDGAKYAQGVKEVLDRLNSSNVTDRPRVLDDVVEKVLLHISASNHDFRISCATTLLTLFVDSSSVTVPGPTFIVIISALSTEYRSLTSIAPNDLLQAFCETVGVSSSNVQDASLVAMLRLIVECDDMAVQSAIQVVENVRQHAGRHIQRRCEQFVKYCKEKELLEQIIRGAQSSSLPDFIEALERPASTPAASEPGLLGFQDTPTPFNRLRYTAYDPPQRVSRLWPGRAGSPHGSSSSFRSEGGSERAMERGGLQDSMDAINMSLAAVSLGLELNAKVSDGPSADHMTRPDLINLDSPFVLEGSLISTSEQFEKLWNNIEESRSARGWSNAPVDELLRDLQMLEKSRLQVISTDLAPFIGELKVIITMTPHTTKPVVLRLRESEEDSSLWRLKGEEEELRRVVKMVLEEK